jgi:tRNA wybutosine-synthesizing protein 1
MLTFVELAVLFALGVAAWLFLRRSRTTPVTPATPTHTSTPIAPPTASPKSATSPATAPSAAPKRAEKSRCVIIFATIAGTTERLARDLAARIQAHTALRHAVDVSVVSADKYDADEFLNEDGFVFLLAATYTEGTAPPTSARLFEWLTWEADSPRSGNAMRRAHFAVFGLGNSIYGKYFNAAGRTFDRCFYQLGAARLVQRGIGDESRDLLAQFDQWCELLFAKMAPLCATGSRPVAHAEAVPAEASAADSCGDDCGSGAATTNDDDNASGEPVLDMEDMGGGLDGEVDAATTAELLRIPNEERREMLTNMQRRTLSKQGYQLLGSHSAVKMCRWTKAQLRGRGGCYKHTFYGIVSYLCMETTPSLACANKCVFCWRHHKNPVGRDFVWKMDPPEMLVEEAVKKHVGMIKQFRGVPGVVPERLAEAMTPRHCALSLVGEPIVYPEINRFCDLLHERRISSFLVTNAQFPEQMESLKPITQLYISCDAASKDELKAVDRPIFEDFWERFLTSIDALSRKQQRTVFRMTLVDHMNMTDVSGYAELIRRGHPDLVEVKGVTYCGGGPNTNPLTMANVPWHHQVVDFTQRLAEAIGSDGGLEYGVASEHEHSVCVLLARKDKFYRNGKWWTWIDFDRFLELVKSGEPFTTTDYMLETPDWAQFGAVERGFDPAETRFRRNQAIVEPVATGDGGC